VDGEGQGRRPHVYTYLSAAEEDGRVVSIGNRAGLRTLECLDFLVNLPDRALVVGYAFTYDLTKILQDCPKSLLYSLFHESTRQYVRHGRVQYHRLKWRGYSLNYLNRKLTLVRGSQRVTIWDVFRFFQSKFTTALMDWGVAPKEELREMEHMKANRSRMDALPWDRITAYCDSEVRYLCKLTRMLIEAHKAAGLELTEYYGAGSTAGAFLKRIDVKSRKGSTPDAMRVPIATAFFGGRFENSVIGPVQGQGGPVINSDISSAYPYHATLLPCLTCGVWSHVRYPLDFDGSGDPLTKRIREGRLALVRWTSPDSGRGLDPSRPWGPLPVRSALGTIIFPLAGLGGWSWRDEFLAALALVPPGTLVAREAWVYDCDCEHRPFGDVPTYYRERLKLSADGDAKGLVLKLGLNSVYGKLVQSIGTNPPYQSWVWGGNITSGCRAQLLQVIAQDPTAVFMLATDGVWSTRRVKLPEPEDTGTSDTSKPLGGWVVKDYPRGVFAVRPGIYSPLYPTEAEMEKVRARGLGRKVLYDNWQRVVEAWADGADHVEIPAVERFVGAKSGVTKGEVRGVKRSPDYGEWVANPVNVTFNPLPKRVAVRADRTLEPWGYLDWESVPYSDALKDPEALMLALAEVIAEEQPNVDFGEMDADA
jgi:hypothetical protein